MQAKIDIDKTIAPANVSQTAHASGLSEAGG
jgi:hypothetical protein